MSFLLFNLITPCFIPEPNGFWGILAKYLGLCQGKILRHNTAMAHNFNDGKDRETKSKNRKPIWFGYNAHTPNKH